MTDGPRATATRTPATVTPTPGWTWLRLGLLTAWLALLVGAVALGQRDPDPTTSSGPVSDVWGMYVPQWLGALALACAALTLCSLIWGPEPWRATRWAWFWLTANPLGLLAFLLLAGPMAGIPRPAPHARRLSGGWSFVIGSVVSTVLVNVGLR